MIKDSSDKKLKKTITIPGIGVISVGPHAVSSTEGEPSIKKILDSIEKIQKEKIFPPVDHVAA
jgi:hypothetical protein